MNPRQLCRVWYIPSIFLAWRYLSSMAEQSRIGVLFYLLLHWVEATAFLFLLPFKFSFYYSDVFYNFILFFCLVWFLLYQSQLCNLVYFVYHPMHIRVFPHILKSPHNILEGVALTWEVGGLPSSLTAQGREDLFNPMSGLQGPRHVALWGGSLRVLFWHRFLPKFL